MNQHPAQISRNAGIVRMRVQKGCTLAATAKAHGISITAVRSVLDRYYKHVHTATHSQRFGKPDKDRK